MDDDDDDDDASFYMQSSFGCKSLVVSPPLENLKIKSGRLRTTFFIRRGFGSAQFTKPTLTKHGFLDIPRAIFLRVVVVQLFIRHPLVLQPTSTTRGRTPLTL